VSTPAHGAEERELTPEFVDTQTIVVVTGATSGIGRIVAERIASTGHSTVLLCRNPERARIACEEISTSTSNPNVAWTRVDFASLASIRACAERLADCLPRIDTLVNNAGHFGAGFNETEDGFEAHLQINYLAPFLLIHLLLELLRASSRPRIVNVAGETARFARLRLDDLDRRRRFSVLGAYGQSKLALLFLTRTLAESLATDGVVVNALQPGMAATGHLAAGPRWLDRFWRFVSPGPERAADAVVRLALAEHRLQHTGRYYIGRHRAPVPCPVRRRSLARALYQETLRRVALAPGRQLAPPA
jgi:NAD(P)-dependent dehydrogenase (short-subunit alcohol dehydrogenase family)